MHRRERKLARLILEHLDNNQDGQRLLSISYLAKKTGYSPEKIRQVLDFLESKGQVEIIRWLPDPETRITSEGSKARNEGEYSSSSKETGGLVEGIFYILELIAMAF